MNNLRYDLSDRLIHFFRAVDPSHLDTPVLPEHWSFASIECWDDPFSPFYMLRNAVRSGRLWATWSVRGERRTIYGPDPAVCFTEMPIAAFVEAGEARSQRGEAMSAYGLVFPKATMFSNGARPVIYGLSGGIDIDNRPDSSRIISTGQLAEREQYRYVTYNPTGSHPIDWTHEREWRWPLRDALPVDPNDIPPDIENLHGLDIDQPGFTGLGAVVKTSRQAEQLVYDILTKVDRDDISQEHFAFVLSLQAVGDISGLRDREGLSSAIDEAMVDLSTFFTVPEARAKQIVARFDALAREIEIHPPDEFGQEVGGCWLWTTANDHEFTRSMLSKGRIQVTAQGKYIAPIPEFSSNRNLAQRQKMTLELAERLKSEFGVHSTYLSVLGSNDADAIPFYNGDELDNRMFYNYSDDQEDY